MSDQWTSTDIDPFRAAIIQAAKDYAAAWRATQVAARVKPKSSIVQAGWFARPMLHPWPIPGEPEPRPAHFNHMHALMIIDESGHWKAAK